MEKPLYSIIELLNSMIETQKIWLLHQSAGSLFMAEQYEAIMNQLLVELMYSLASPQRKIEPKKRLDFMQSILNNFYANPSKQIQMTSQEWVLKLV